VDRANEPWTAAQGRSMMDSWPGDCAALTELCCAIDSGHGCSSWRFQEEEAVMVILTSGSSRRQTCGYKLTVLRGGSGR
jgi:hypothetical protein